uniref:Uncharacterized protein LOC104225604 n=1 Tax=Nicotiana sylvestris TaxID=4096 RepID=A0A1U7WAS9_NICSY|nr:PREDICTED: uncharacterized protein LOC104225604 [Nicotiana sylvestris]
MARDRQVFLYRLLRPGESTIIVRNQQSSPLLTPNDTYMNFIIWNCRGVRSADFRRNFRSLLDYNHPSLVVILKTHCRDHQHLKEEFNFNGLLEEPAIGQLGGIAILWATDALTVDYVASTRQEIHCHIQAVTPTAG